MLFSGVVATLFSNIRRAISLGRVWRGPIPPSINPCPAATKGESNPVIELIDLFATRGGGIGEGNLAANNERDFPHEFGAQPGHMPVDAHDLNSTIIRRMGIDHLKLTYLYQGRDMRLTDVKGSGEFSAKLLAL